MSFADNVTAFLTIIIAILIPIFGGWLAYLTKQVDALRLRDEQISVEIAEMKGKLDHIAEMLNEIRFFCREKGGMILGPKEN